MLATPGPLPHGDAWTFELKWDGIRAIVAHDQATPGIRIFSRNQNDLSATFPELAGLADVLADHTVVLDGEIVAFDAQGRPSFNRIQERLGIDAATARVRSQSNPVVFAAFDLLHMDGFSTRSLPLKDRRRLLEQLGLENGAHWRLSTQHADGEALREATRSADLEGVIAKRLDAPYSPGQRSPSWVKIKNNTIDEFVIGGWVPGEGRRDSMIGALLLGTLEADDPDASMRWIGKVGTGFTVAELERLFAMLDPDRTTTRPFENDPGEKNAIYVSSRRVCRVEYREWTAQGTLRFPSYKGLV